MTDQPTEPETEEPAPAAKAKTKTGKKPHELPGLVGDLTRQTNAVLALKAEFGALMSDDEDLAADMIEGETGFREAITAGLAQIVLDEGFAKAKREFSRATADSAKRLETRAEKIRASIARAMEIAGEPKVPTVAGTVSLSDTPITAIITEEADIPSEFWVEQDPKLDKSKLNTAVRETNEDGTFKRDIPGVSRSNGGKTIRITGR